MEGLIKWEECNDGCQKKVLEHAPLERFAFGPHFAESAADDDRETDALLPALRDDVRHVGRRQRYHRDIARPVDVRDGRDTFPTADLRVFRIHRIDAAAIAVALEREKEEWDSVGFDLELVET